MIPALDHLLARLLINQPWIGTQALGLGHFGHPPLGHLQHIRGLSLSLSPSRGPVESSHFIVTLLGHLQYHKQREGQRQRQKQP